jgi:hypothetical protein
MSAPAQIVLSRSNPAEIRPAVRDGQLTFFWGAPPSDGGSAITSYTLSCTAASITETYGPTVFSATITGLTNGTEYLFTIYATNAIGDGPPAQYRSVQPGLRPSAAQNVAVTNNGDTAQVTWDASASDGGATIKWYVIQALSSNTSDSVIKVSAAGTDRLKAIMGLNTASIYEFTVWAVNDPGYSQAANSPSNLLVWLYAPDYSGSGTWLDKSSYSRNATLETGVIAINGIGNGIILNGSTNWTFPAIGSHPNWTLSIWFKQTANSVGESCVVTEIYSGGTLNMMIEAASSPNSLRGSFFDGQFRHGTPFVMTYDTWKNIVITWNGTNIITYIDNSVDSTINYSGNTASSTNNNAYRIGRRWDFPEYVTGEIGEVRIYDYALSSGQISALYTTYRSVFPL